ncbi:XRE family transcriptional regulator [Devosia sp. PTR5]|uniref:XRE family transcriptional regulator n=1 Tax=Devosia oryzisoli TaxID=2774138 RepID=A0A927FWH0_9HYPH|nr:XRE family transcriptional regulator [Devosia oryzisoli]MBD8065919.1 XRE family transcriptional regulator [Devosia oryzisoli]
MIGVKITGRLIAAARALVGVPQDDFAAVAGLTPVEMQHLEASGSARVTNVDQLVAIARALDYYGVVVIEEGEGMGAGVRLKFSRTDVLQITRLESEGGAIGADDSP